MDLNEKYAAHQKAMMSAAGAPAGAKRDGQLGLAASIAAQIGQYQACLGAAAACAWSAASLAAIVHPALAASA